MYMLGWSGTNGDPDYFLSSLLHGDNVGSSNREFYDNDEVDEFLNQAKLSIDRDERASFTSRHRNLLLMTHQWFH